MNNKQNKSSPSTTTVWFTKLFDNSDNKLAIKIYCIWAVIFSLWYFALKVWYLLDDISFSYKYELFPWQRHADRIVLRSDPTWILSHYILGIVEVTFCSYCIIFGHESYMKSTIGRIPFYAFFGSIVMNISNFRDFTPFTSLLIILTMSSTSIFARIRESNIIYVLILTSKLFYEFISRLAYGGMM